MPKRFNATLTAITVKKDVIDVYKLLGVIAGVNLETVKGIRTDLQKTTRTWKHKVLFTIQIDKSGGGEVSVYTDNEIYSYVNYGTKPHIIRPRNAKRLAFYTPFKAKTRVRFLGSGNGMKGNNLVLTQEVHHPGTEAREWDIVISEKWQPLHAAKMARRIEQAVNART